MPIISMLLLLSCAATCFADDPLESLNTAEDPMSTMEHFFDRAARQGNGNADGSRSGNAGKQQRTHNKIIYFVGEQPLDAHGWVRVMPCTEEGALSQAAPYPQSCVPPTEQMRRRGSYFWKTREASPADLQPGVVVVARDKATDGAWYLARITDVSEAASGYLAVSAPCRVKIGSIRVVDR